MNVVLLLASMVWQVDEGWVEAGVDNWELNASGAGSYSIVGSFEDEIIEVGLMTRWRQELNGSNSNNSNLELIYSDSTVVRIEVGQNGSDDRMAVSTSDTSLFVTHELFNFAEEFDIDLVVNLVGNELAFFISPHGEGIHLELCEFGGH